MKIKPPRNFSSHTATLTPELVREIRREDREARRELMPLPAVYWARKYAMSAESIRKVLRYETWGWVPDEEGALPSESAAGYVAQVEARQVERSGLTEEAIKASGERVMKMMEDFQAQRRSRVEGLTPKLIESLKAKGQWTEQDEKDWQSLQPKS